MGHTVYLDYNATAPIRPQVVEVMARAQMSGGNPSSVHGSGRRARAAVEDTRARLAGLIGAKPAEITFTSGGTEANNLALRGAFEGQGITDFIVSAVEHDAVLASVSALNAFVHHLRVEPNGRPDLGQLETLLREIAAREGKVLVSVMLANNETGVISPLGDIVRLVKDHGGGLVHTDAVQAFGKRPVDFTGLGVDLMSLSAHKLGGPVGVGALVIREGVVLATQNRGGGQELGRRCGTENSAAIVGFAAAAEMAASEFQKFETLSAWRTRLETEVGSIAPDAIFFGTDSPRLANTSCFAVPDLPAETQVMALDLAGVEISAGSACSSGKVRRSHVLTAMGADESQAASGIRVSLGWRSREEDIDQFLDAWGAHYRRAKERHIVRAAQ